MDIISDDNRTSSIVLIVSFGVFILSIFLMEWDALTESFLVFVLAIILPVFALASVRSSGSALQLEKYSYANQYYVSFDDRSIEFSKEKYDEIEDGFVPGYAYSYEYAYNELFWSLDRLFLVEIEKVRI